MTTSRSRSPFRHLWYSGDNVKTLHMLSKCCRCRHWYILICMRFNDCRNRQFRCALHRRSNEEVIGCVLPSQLCEFIKLHLLLPIPLDALLYCCGDCAHHPARFVIFAQLAPLCVFIILIFPILPIVRTYKITQTVSDCTNHRLKCLFVCLVHQSCDVSFFHTFMLLLNHCLCISNLVSCPGGFSLNIILHPFLFLFIAWEVRFSLFLDLKLPFGLQGAQYPKGLDSFSFQTVLAFIRLIMSLGWPLCRFAIFAYWMWRNDLFRSIDHCNLHWLCCWVRCWMLQEMDTMEASCVFHVKVGTFTHLEQSKINLLTVNKLGIVRLTLQHDLIVSVSFM